MKFIYKNEISLLFGIDFDIYNDKNIECYFDNFREIKNNY